jgi:hypothetical protein
MAYHGYNNLIAEFAASFVIPKVLEIGVDKGQALFPITNYFSKLCGNENENRTFIYTGVDIVVREHVNIASTYINQSNMQGPNQVGLIELIESNSLEALPALISRGSKYSAVLIDGDHNYHTVSRELNFALELVSDGGIIVCDDYDGEGGSQDEYFSEHPNFYNDSEKNENFYNLISRQEQQDNNKVGVKGAVDEFLINNPDWSKYKFFSDEPVVLYNKKYTDMNTGMYDGHPSMVWKFKF